MKTLYFISAFLLAASVCSLGQFKAGNVELGLSGCLGSMNTESTYNGRTTSQSCVYLALGAMPLIYITDGLALEPEIGFFALSNYSPSIYIVGNIEYSHMIENSKFAIFVRTGYGISNSLVLTYLDKPLKSTSSDGLNISIVNLGAGFKYFISKNIALRGELNIKFQKYSESYSSKYYSYTSDYNWRTISFLYGFAVML